MIAVTDISRAIEAMTDKTMAATWAELLVGPMDRTEINSARRTAAFLANAAEESAGFTKLEEDLRYSAARLMKVWPSRFPTHASAQPYEFEPQKLANLVYANRMGNGPPENGDGWRFRGRGLFMLTGRNAYRRASAALRPFLPPAPTDGLEADPDQVKQPEMAALTACWFWGDINGNVLADDEHLTLLCKRINGGLNGLEERRALYRLALKALTA